MGRFTAFWALSRYQHVVMQIFVYSILIYFVSCVKQFEPQNLCTKGHIIMEFNAIKRS